jgi:membrane-associated phospholipid phosphatase
MTVSVALILAAVTAILLVIEHRWPHRMTLELSFKGDVKRESAFLAQYGQSVATPIAAWLAAIAKGNDWRVFAFVCLPVLACSLTCAILKRLSGRMRPNRENAGRFTGPSWRRKNSRESFPSSHSACAFACTVALIHVWPEAAVVFWILASITAVLRFVMSAHFPGDIVAGSAIGVGLGAAVARALAPSLLH